ncbi:Coiled-coil domain-containing protein 66 [Popillia japonica]|uniref:Coiled-coil domain-containing protein 66 n=1 Tax=Popillia japonica TaxID=7064 RepID=A0AAW1JDX2_POPJA
MYTERKQSLIERKKLQWAKEREELAELNSVWGRDANVIRFRNATKGQTIGEVGRREPRRQSLPPLYKNHNSSNYTSCEKLDKEMGGETSGYGSDNANNSPEHYQAGNWDNTLGYESSSSAREDRLKWGDRGVHVGKFWEPKAVDNFSKNDTPGWVKRGLEGKTELVVSNTSPAESPEQEYLDRDRPSTSSTNSQLRSYIRGQNVPIEPIELAERERRRQIALAHQEAIREQLEDRERRRKEERERKLKEEYEEELRIKREKEIERLRKEKEEQEAIEIAEKQARQERNKIKAKHINDVNITENLIEKENIKSPRHIENNVKENNIALALKTDGITQGSSKEMHCKLQNLIDNDYVVTSTYNNKYIDSRNVMKIKNEVTNNAVQPNKDEFNHNFEDPEDTPSKKKNDKILVPPLDLPQSSTVSDNLALVLQTPYETLQNMQFAVLMPTSGQGPATALPIAIPLTINTDRTSPRTENRILTPSQYRNKRFCDSSTQTELSEISKNNENIRDKYVREKLSNLEINFDNRSRKERRMRHDDRSRENVEERPKWGVNRPPTRYLKQSEKDPVYQRRKLRQKLRQVKNYEDKTNNYSPHSSDESQTASPRMYRKNSYPEKRHSRALWRKHDQLFSQNVRVYQTEIVPLEADKDHIYYKRKQCHQCCCRCRDDKDHIKVVDILKIQHATSPTDCIPYPSENLKDQMPDSMNNNSMDSCSEIYDKIQNDLSAKQDHWEN